MLMKNRESARGEEFFIICGFLILIKRDNDVEFHIKRLIAHDASSFAGSIGTTIFLHHINLSINIRSMKNQILLITATAALISPIWAGDTPGTTQNTQTDSVTSATEGGKTDLATQLANPLAALISLPIQANYDDHFGLDGKGEKWLINVQPVIPFTLNDDWNVISRTIIPLIDQSGYTNSDFNESGLGDILQSVWISPAKPISNGWIWGVGGAFLLPTASDDVLGSGKWGAGPTAVALKQSGHWTYGGLTNHVSSFAGDSDRNYVNSTFIQPFLTYIIPTKTTFAINSESSFD